LKAYCDIGSKNPSFLKCYGISKHPNSEDYIIVLEYAAMGSLRQNLRSVAEIEWKDKLNLLQCIASDLQIIHSHNLIHRDLHSGNILLNSLKSAYIADLGLSITANIESKTKCWSKEPEKRPTAKEIVDIFAEWQNNENILSELTESDRKLQSIKNEDIQAYIESNNEDIQAYIESNNEVIEAYIKSNNENNFTSPTSNE
ncbi:1960_t:CDS:2, partial [Ambispora leptoticha]